MVGNRVINLIAMALVWAGCCAAALADGTTYYVRQGGSDLSDGLTPQMALRSIQRAVSRCAGDGNTIVVGPGVYFEQVSVGAGAGAAAGNGSVGQPNMIVADAIGSETGDDAGAVIIHGDGVREYGITLSERDDWAIVGIEFRGQTQSAIDVEKCDGIEIESCTIETPDRAGIETNDADRLHIDGNTFIRTDNSGSCIVVKANRHAEKGHAENAIVDDDGHGAKRDDKDEKDKRDDEHDRGHARGRYRRRPATPDVTALIECNRFAMTGDAYLASDFNRGGHGRRKHHDEEICGIRAELSGEGAAIRIINNAGSDCWAGISVTLDGDRATGIIANNSLAGCRTGIEVDARDGAILLGDNIVAHSRFAIAAQGHERNLTISGLLTFDIGGSVVLGEGGLKSIAGHVPDVDPRWVAPAAGNFALEPDSPAIDAGLGVADIYRDMRGLDRPVDGDGDETARIDLGAYEFHPGEAQNRRLRLVQWREIEPQ